MRIVIKNMSKKYQVDYFSNKVIFDDFNMEISNRKINFIVGNSGVGKTTLLNIIALVEKMDSGYYSINGKKINYKNRKEILKYRNQKIGFIHQEAMLLKQLSVIDNILIPAYIRGKVDEKMYSRANELMEKFVISNLKNVCIKKLSGGEKQRVEMARALINNPEIIVADEPTASLDDENANTIIEQLKGLSDEGHLVIIATHDKRILNTADNIINLK